MPCEGKAALDRTSSPMLRTLRTGCYRLPDRAAGAGDRPDRSCCPPRANDRIVTSNACSFKYPAKLPSPEPTDRAATARAASAASAGCSGCIARSIAPQIVYVNGKTTIGTSDRDDEATGHDRDHGDVGVGHDHPHDEHDEDGAERQDGVDGDGAEHEAVLALVAVAARPAAVDPPEPAGEPRRPAPAARAATPDGTEQHPPERRRALVSHGGACYGGRSPAILPPCGARRLRSSSSSDCVIGAVTLSGWWVRRTAFVTSRTGGLADDILADPILRGDLARRISEQVVRRSSAPTRSPCAGSPTPTLARPQVATLFAPVLGDIHARLIGVQSGPVDHRARPARRRARRRARPGPAAGLPRGAPDQGAELGPRRTQPLRRGGCLRWRSCSILLGLALHPWRAAAVGIIGVGFLAAAVLLGDRGLPRTRARRPRARPTSRGWRSSRDIAARPATGARSR